MNAFFAFLQQNKRKYWSPTILFEWQFEGRNEGQRLKRYLVGNHGKINWLEFIFITLKSLDHKLKFSFRYGGKLFIPVENVSAQAGWSPYEKTKEGSAIASMPALAPLQDVQTETASDMLADRQLLHQAIAKLPVKTRAIAERFLREEDIAPGEFAALIRDLKSIIVESCAVTT